MKKNILTIMLACAVGVPTGLHAQQGWTLRQCIDYAIENNINIRKAANTMEQSAVDVNTAKWARLPNLNGSAGQNWSWGRTASPEDNTYSDVNSGTTSFSLNTDIPLFTGFNIPNQQQLSKLNYQAALEDMNKAKEDLGINIAYAYLQVLFNQELNKVATGQVTLSEEQLTRLSRLAELGKASFAQVAEAKARVAQDEMSAVQADNNYQLSLLDLSQLLELPSPEKFYLAQQDTAVVFGELTAPDNIYTEAILNRPGIRAAQLRLQGTENSIKIAQSNYYPQLSFSARISSSFYTMNGLAGNDFFSQLDNNQNKYIGFNLSVPIFNRFATRNKVRTAKLQQLNMSLELDNTKKTLYKEIQQAWYNAVAAEAKYNSSEVAVEANEESYRLMKEKFENGKATSIEFNEAKLNLTKATSDRVQAKYDYIFRTKILDFYKGIPIE